MSLGSSETSKHLQADDGTLEIMDLIHVVFWTGKNPLVKTSKVVGRSFLFPSGRTNKISVLLSSPPVHPAALRYVPPTLRYQTSLVYFFSLISSTISTKNVDTSKH